MQVPQTSSDSTIRIGRLTSRVEQVEGKVDNVKQDLISIKTMLHQKGVIETESVTTTSAPKGWYRPQGEMPPYSPLDVGIADFEHLWKPLASLQAAQWVYASKSKPRIAAPKLTASQSGARVGACASAVIALATTGLAQSMAGTVIIHPLLLIPLVLIAFGFMITSLAHVFSKR